MKKTDLEERFIAFQKTIDFHSMGIQGLFSENCRVTLIVRDILNDDPVCIYTNESAEKALACATKKLKEKKRKTKAKTKRKTKRKAKRKTKRKN